MNLLTNPKNRNIKMVQTRVVSKAEKIIFPIVVVVFVALLLPDTAPLIISAIAAGFLLSVFG